MNSAAKAEARRSPQRARLGGQVWCLFCAAALILIHHKIVEYWSCPNELFAQNVETIGYVSPEQHSKQEGPLPANSEAIQDSTLSSVVGVMTLAEETPEEVCLVSAQKRLSAE